MGCRKMVFWRRRRSGFRPSGVRCHRNRGHRLDQQSGQSASDPLRTFGVGAKIARDFRAFEERDEVVLSNLFAFVVAVVAIWLNMATVKAVLGIWMNDERATLAAFAFYAGVLVAGVLVGVRALPAYDDTVIGPCAGAVVAFAGLWWVHFGRARRRLHMAEQAAQATTV